MKRDKQTGLVLPNALAIERNKMHASVQLRKARRFYSYNCKKCGHHESFKTKQELKDFKKEHRTQGCPMVAYINPVTGVRKMIRKQLYDKIMEEAAQIREAVLSEIHRGQRRAMAEAAKIERGIK